MYTYFIRLTAQGDTVWTKFYGDGQTGQHPNAGNYVNIGDTNFVFIGTFAPKSSDSTQIMLVKIDSSGTVLWDYRFGDAGLKTNANDIAATPDGGYIITGWTTGWGISNYASTFLLKVDALGQEEWHKVYSIGYILNGVTVEVTATNGYMVGGGGSPATGVNTFLNVLKTDSLGNLLWSKNYGSPYRDAPVYLTKYQNTTTYIIAGAINIPIMTPGGLEGNFERYLAKINGSNGNIIWADTMGITEKDVDDVYSSNVIILADGSIVGVGATVIPGSGVDAWIVKYDGNGNFLWQRKFNKYGAAGQNHNYFWDVQPTPDGGFVLTGTLSDFSVPEQNLWVVKLDSMGCDVSNCTVGVADVMPNKDEVLVYPNPNTGRFTIALDSPKKTNILIYNTSGQLVLQKSSTTATVQINLNNQPTGLYLVQITNNNTTVTKRIVVQ